YAALLHDFGKVGVREHVLVKANKLYPHELEQVKARFELIRARIEIERLRARLEERPAPDADRRAQELDEIFGFILGCAGPTIPVESKMMAIADVFDALTASDRPYKKAVPVDEALDILHAEVRAAKLDAALLDVFIASQVYKDVLPKSA